MRGVSEDGGGEECELAGSKEQQKGNFDNYISCIRWELCQMCKLILENPMAGDRELVDRYMCKCVW